MSVPLAGAIDLVPKFIIASGELTKILIHTDVLRYLEFKQIAGSFVYRDGRISKVPSTEMEAVRSSLMGIFEKRRAKKFFEFIQGWKDDDPVTHQGQFAYERNEMAKAKLWLTSASALCTPAGLNLDTDPMKKVYEKFGLELGTQDFIGHAMALYLDDECVLCPVLQSSALALADFCSSSPRPSLSYITKPARPTYDRIILYTSSMARYGKSPYIYPLYGLGELPQAFARLSAIHGGTYMLDKPVDQIVTDPATGKFVGVRSGEETVKAPMVIGSPDYFGAGKEDGDGGKMRVVEEGKVIRAICLLKNNIPGTDESDSVQIIIPQNQVNRRNGASILPPPLHLTKPELTPLFKPVSQTSTSPRFLARITSAPRATLSRLCPPSSRRPRRNERFCPESSSSARSSRSQSLPLQRPPSPLPSARLTLPLRLSRFVSISPLYTPTASGKEDNIFITKSYDATSHFETVVDDVRTPLLFSSRSQCLNFLSHTLTDLDLLLRSPLQVKDVWQRIMGEPLVLTEKPKIAEDEEN